MAAGGADKWCFPLVPHCGLRSLLGMGASTEVSPIPIVLGRHRSIEDDVASSLRVVQRDFEAGCYNEAIVSLRNNLDRVGLPEGKCFAKITIEGKHRFWVVVVTHPSESYGGILLSQYVLVEDFKRTPEAFWCVFGGEIMREDVADLELLFNTDGTALATTEDVLRMFDIAFAQFPGVLHDAGTHGWDALCKIRSIEFARDQNVEPKDELGVRRLVTHVNERRELISRAFKGVGYVSESPIRD